MRFFDTLSVKARLTMLVALALAGLALVAAAGWSGMNQIVNSADVMTTRHLPAERLIGELRAGIGNLRRFEKDTFLHTGDPVGLEKYLPRWQAALQASRKSIEQLEPLLDDAGRELVPRVRQSLDSYAQGFEGVAARPMRGEFGDAVVANAAMEPMKTPIRQLDELLKSLSASVEASAAAERSEIAADQRRKIGLQAGVLLLAGSLLVVLAAALVRSVMRPLQRANAALERLSAGDLSESLASDGRDELSQMIRGLVRTQAALRTLVEGIQGNARSVATASAQIAQGNADLSARTESQAASLQETAASMEQLTATVRQGAETARQANGLAQAASDSARQGGAEVAQVVATMTGIQEASRRIADITGVIDGIAFQTNILALNAAVEAARAGEQGRGFAVVAAEVRTLARRSAEAAREIKGLIGASVERVEAGSQLVQQAGGTIDKVVQQVQRVTGMMAEISGAAAEQQQGIAQVSDAVSQLDQATQHNASLVEEAAAAASSLRQQAEGLTAAAGVFKLQAGTA